MAKLGRMARRECEGVFDRHCEEHLRRSNPASAFFCRSMDCFAYARNDGRTTLSVVMTGLDPAIHAFLARGSKNVDARDEPGHDGNQR